MPPWPLGPIDTPSGCIVRIPAGRLQELWMCGTSPTRHPSWGFGSSSTAQPHRRDLGLGITVLVRGVPPLVFGMALVALLSAVAVAMRPNIGATTPRWLAQTSQLSLQRVASAVMTASPDLTSGDNCHHIL